MGSSHAGAWGDEAIRARSRAGWLRTRTRGILISVYLLTYFTYLHLRVLYKLTDLLTDLLTNLLTYR